MNELVQKGELCRRRKDSKAKRIICQDQFFSKPAEKKAIQKPSVSTGHVASEATKRGDLPREETQA